MQPDQDQNHTGKNPLSLNPALRNRRTDITLDRQTLMRNGLNQRISSLIAASTAAGAGYGTVTPPDPEHISCRLYLVANGPENGSESTPESGGQTAIHLEITYKESASGGIKTFEKYGSRHNMIGTISDGKIGFNSRFIDDQPLTPDQKQYLEATLKPFA